MKSYEFKSPGFLFTLEQQNHFNKVGARSVFNYVKDGEIGEQTEDLKHVMQGLCHRVRTRPVIQSSS